MVREWKKGGAVRFGMLTGKLRLSAPGARLAYALAREAQAPSLLACPGIIRQLEGFCFWRFVLRWSWGCMRVVSYR
ncbi:hypothetical protein [Aneurinibacillus soli]|uniref:hypothetical protein n=1 Tax=Aneurinibacillus soli TaxID=1500254 RepID=UPI001E2A43FE|nr:hypothetical protein [Aneurinibacillus soli]